MNLVFEPSEFQYTDAIRAQGVFTPEMRMIGELIEYEKLAPNFRVVLTIAMSRDGKFDNRDYQTREDAVKYMEIVAERHAIFTAEQDFIDELSSVDRALSAWAGREIRTYGRSVKEVKDKLRAAAKAAGRK